MEGFAYRQRSFPGNANITEDVVCINYYCNWLFFLINQYLLWLRLVFVWNFPHPTSTFSGLAFSFPSPCTYQRPMSWLGNTGGTGFLAARLYEVQTLLPEN